MKRFSAFSMTAALAFLLTACGRNEEPPRPIAEIKGKPINAPAAAMEAPDASNGATQEVAEAPAPAPTSVVASAPSEPAPPAATNLVDGYLKVGFDLLASFNYIMPDEVSPTNQPPADQFPKSVRALDQKQIALRGFMLPLKIDQGLVTELLIMRDQSMCCFGTSPKITEWVSVKMNEKGVKPVMDQPVTLFGKLRVGEMRENGYLVGIYQIDGDKMEWQ